jgi:tetratricopeptide (TPR) repeat protein
VISPPNTSTRDSVATRPEHVANGDPPAWLAAVLLLVAIGAVYYHALAVPFLFDDVVGIKGNEAIYSLWPLIGTTNHPGPLNPVRDLPTSGRPLVSLSFALNYAVGSDNPVGYHAANVAIHFLTALLLWAIVRRVLRLPYFAGRFDSSAGWLALATAQLWALHPLQTEAVVYTTQRTELMMAFFYFATLYCSLRYWESSARRMVWLTLAVFASLAGMASKEVMVSAPLLVLLFERTFIAGSLAKAVRRSWPLYVTLASTWLLLLLLNVVVPRGKSAGFGLGPPLVDWWLTQAQMVLIYLKLVVWPQPLLIHYHLPYLDTFADAWMYVVPVVLFGMLTLVLLWQNKPTGFLFTFVCAILIPTSVVPILTEMGAERRMYLPLAAFVVLFVVGGYSLVQKLACANPDGPRTVFRSNLTWIVPVATAVAFALMLGVASAKRVFAYDDPSALWDDVLRHQPNNYLAHTARGMLLEGLGRRSEAIDELHRAAALKPDHPVALNNLGVALNQVERPAEAVEAFQAALQLAPDYSEALDNRAQTLLQLGQFPEAIEHFERALRLRPEDARAHVSLASALNRAGRQTEALKEYQVALALRDDDPHLRSGLAGILTQMGRYPEAIDQGREALRLGPDCFDAHYSLGTALLHAGRLPEAVVELRAALQLKSDDPPALNTLGATLLQAGVYPEAQQNLERAVQLRPNYAVAHNNLGQVLARTGNIPQAIEQFRLATELDAGFSGAQISWALVLSARGDFKESIEHFEKAIQLGADTPDTRNNLGDAYRKSGDTKRAIEQYEIAVRLNPSFMLGYANLAQTLALVDRSKEALAVSEKAMEVARTTGQLDELGQFEEWLKHYQTELRRAAEAASPHSPSSQK